MSVTYQFTCEWCQKEVILSGRRASVAKHYKQRFCNRGCAISWRNRLRTDNAREERLRRFNEKAKSLCPGTALIPLDKRQVAIVDERDYEALSRYTWHGMTSKYGPYVASRTGSGRGNAPFLLMHRLVAERVYGRQLARGEVVHHINGNPLDNRRENLVVYSNGDHVSLHHRLREAKKQSKQVIKKAA